MPTEKTTNGAETPAPPPDHEFVFPPTLEAGTYRATFAGCREFEATDKITHERKTLLSWGFLVPVMGDDDEELVLTIEGVSSLSLSVRSKGFEWLAGIAPEIVSERRSVKASELIGRECLVTIEPDPDGWLKITGVVSAPKRAASASARA